MDDSLLWIAAVLVPASVGLSRLPARLRLSRAKLPALSGHFRIARLLSRLVVNYQYDGDRFFGCDGAPADVRERRRAGFDRLAEDLAARAPQTIAASRGLEAAIPDVAFVNSYRVPFQFRDVVRKRLRLGALMQGSDGTEIEDLDGNRYDDVGGSYGVNLFGYDFYKSCIDAGAATVGRLGPVLGPYHPIIVDVVERLTRISGLDAVSFHMSGTEAVMQAVKLARFHTGRSHLVMFCGAYHGWWDGVQPTIANDRPLRDVYMLKEMSEATLRVIRERKDIACVLVNPIQAMHPNATAPGDGALVDSSRSARVNRAAYAQWLCDLKRACEANDVVLILDEVFVGFRLAAGGAQEYFGVRADMVTYGKTLAGGLPIGVVCGRRDLMRRYREDRPTRICFARGTFNSHPYVLGAMQAFLQRIDEADIRAQYVSLDEVWNRRAAMLNARLEAEDLPLRAVNLVSVWTINYLTPSRYNWLLQFYLRNEGLALGWIGTGRLIFSHNYTDADFARVVEKFVRAAERMRAGGWWWSDESLTNARIRRNLLVEMLRNRFAGRRARAGAEAPRRLPSPGG